MAVRERMLRRALANWRELNARIGQLREEELVEALSREDSRARPRQTVRTRLIQRLNAVRTAQVRTEA